jgi:hypothetical protein
MRSHSEREEKNLTENQCIISERIVIEYAVNV